MPCESYGPEVPHWGIDVFLHDSAGLPAPSSERMASLPASGRFRWNRASAPGTTSTRPPASPRRRRAPPAPARPRPRCRAGVSSNPAASAPGGGLTSVTATMPGCSPTRASAVTADSPTAATATSTDPGVLPEQPEGPGRVLDPRGPVAALALARPHPAEVEAKHWTSGARHGPGELGAHHVVHGPGLGRRRQHQHRRRLRSAVPETLQHEWTDPDERRALQVLPAAHHGVTRRTRNLR